MFTEQSVHLRELGNGIMFISAICMIAIFSYYLVARFRIQGWKCCRDLASQAAASIVILMAGHAVRAGSSWMEFIWTDVGWNNDFWANSVIFFTIASGLIIIGKMLIIFAFSSYYWRWHITIGAGAISLFIPLIVLLLVQIFS